VTKVGEGLRKQIGYQFLHSSLMCRYVKMRCVELIVGVKGARGYDCGCECECDCDCDCDYDHSVNVNDYGHAVSAAEVESR
jgi:hypothetical protein